MTPCTSVPPRRRIAQTVLLVVLTLVSAAAWTGWEVVAPVQPQVDPDGPASWQVLGTVLTTIVIAVVATLRLPAGLVLAVVPLAYSATLIGLAYLSGGDDPFFVLGVFFAVVWCYLGGVVVVGVTRGVDVAVRRHRARRREQ